MPSGERRKRASTRRKVDDGAGISEQAHFRVAELQMRFNAMKAWGMADHVAAEKVDARWREVEKFLGDWVADKKRDELQIQGFTLDVRTLELATEAVAARIGKPFGAVKAATSFDPAQANDALKAAQVVEQAADDAKKVAKDAAKEAVESVEGAASAVPGWAIAALGLALGLFGLAQVATIARTAGQLRPAKRDEWQ